MLWLGVAIQFLSVALLRVRLGHGWLRRPVAVLVITACVYHGLSELLLRIPSIRAWDSYRLGINQSYIDKANLFISISLLTLTLSYFLMKPERSIPQPREGFVRLSARSLDWRISAIACAPLAVLTYKGGGYNNVLTAAAANTSTDLASTFLVILVALSAFGFLLRYGMRWFVPVLLTELAIVAAAGERIALVAGTVILIVLLAQTGLRATGRQVTLAVILTIIGVLGITGYKITAGSSLYYEQTSLRARVEAVGSGIYTLTHTSDVTDSGPGVVTEFANRFDGDAFAGGILQSMHAGDPMLGSFAVPESALLAVPSFLWSTKLSHPATLSPAAAEVSNFHLQNINFLPTLLGLYYGFIGPYWSISFAAIFGALCGWGERHLFNSSSPVRLVVLAVAIQAALSYEKGLPGMLVALRTAVVLSIAVWLIGIARAGIGTSDAESGRRIIAAKRKIT